MSAARLRVGLIGGGHAAIALGRAWRRDSSLSVAIWARRADQARRAARNTGARRCDQLEELVRHAQVVVLAVPDAAITSVGRELTDRLTQRTVVLHLAGAWPAQELLSPLAARKHSVGVLHPLLPLTGRASTAHGLADISGDRRALIAARRLARAAGLEPHVVPDRDRALLHLASVLAAGDLTALVAGSIEWLMLAGLKPAAARDAALGLAQTALRNLASLSAADALTGPAMRGDLATMQRHAATLDRRGLSLAPAASAHRWLSALAIQIAVQGKRIDASKAPQLFAALGLPASAPGRTLRGSRRLARPEGSP